MYKVLNLCKTQGSEAISIVRAMWPMRVLNQQPDWQCRIATEEQMLSMARRNDWKPALGYDLVVATRVHGPRRDNPFEVMCADGARLVYDCDDDLTDRHRLQGWGEWVSETVEMADAVTTSTPFLKGVMEETYGKPAYALPNYIDVGWYAASSLKAGKLTDKLVIGLCGTSTHFFDWCLVLDALEKVVERHPEVLVVTAGYEPPYMSRVPHEHIDAVPFQAYPALLRQFDIRLCPLEDDAFNASKSDIAAIEAMAAARKDGKLTAGCIPVATDCTVFRASIQHDHNGLLVKDGQWEEALEYLLARKVTRRRLAVEGHRWVKAHRDLSCGVQDRADAYRKILEG